MNQQEFIELIVQPHQLNRSQAEAVGTLTEEFPFFQSAQLLYTLGLKDHAPHLFQKQLRKTAIVVNNRAVLYELLHQPAKARVPVSTEIKNLPSSDEKKTEKETETVIKKEEKQKFSPVTVTHDEVKVIYVTTTVSEQKNNSVKETEEENQVIETKPSELEIIQEIENTTETPENQVSNEERFNKEIEIEISKGLVDSYIQTEVIKTPELHQEPKTEDQVTEEKDNIQLETTPGSFLDWLRKVQYQDITEQKTVKEIDTHEDEKLEKEPISSEKMEKKKLIDKIIESDPGKIRMNKDKFYTATQDAKQSLLENEHLVTETLAKIYALQGNISKAIRAYEILSLKFPQKSAYFASLIEKLKTK